MMSVNWSWTNRIPTTLACFDLLGSVDLFTSPSPLPFVETFSFAITTDAASHLVGLVWTGPVLCVAHQDNVGPEAG